MSTVLPWLLAFALYVQCGRLTWRTMLTLTQAKAGISLPVSAPVAFCLLWLLIIAGA